MKSALNKHWPDLLKFGQENGRVLGLQRLESATLATLGGILKTQDPHTEK